MSKVPTSTDIKDAAPPPPPSNDCIPLPTYDASYPGYVPGDILVETAGSGNGIASYHILIMLTEGDGKKVGAHSSNEGSLDGARQFGMGTMTKNFQDKTVRVFRCRNAEISKCAAKYAASFSKLNKDASACITPYGHLRTTAGDDSVRVFSVDSVFRAMRACYRGSLEVSLSQKKGVTCSQFVTYCYHAAVVDTLLKQRRISMPMMLLPVMKPGWRTEHKESKQVPYRLAQKYIPLKTCTTIATIMPDAIRWDAKSMNSEFLVKCLEMSSDFYHVGNLVRHDGVMIVDLAKSASPEKKA